MIGPVSLTERREKLIHLPIANQLLIRFHEHALARCIELLHQCEELRCLLVTGGAARPPMHSRGVRRRRGVLPEHRARAVACRRTAYEPRVALASTAAGVSSHHASPEWDALAHKRLLRLDLNQARLAVH